MNAIHFERILGSALMAALLCMLVACRGGSNDDNALDSEAPTITALDRSAADIGEMILVNGRNFGSVQAESSISLNGVPFAVQDWSDISIRAMVSPGMSSGIIVVTVRGQSSQSGSSAQLFIPSVPLVAPVINSLSPGFGKRGVDTVTITGSGFGSGLNSSHVYFADAQSRYEAELVTLDTGGIQVPQWTPNSIKVLVPLEAPGACMVSVEVNGLESNSLAFNALPSQGVVALKIDSIEPLSAEPGQSITISGSGFGDSQADSVVMLSGKIMEVLSWTVSSIRVRVPEAATSGPIIVRVGANSEDSGQTLTVVIVPVITSCSPGLVEDGGSLLIR
jgi:hypothetical protein